MTHQYKSTLASVCATSFNNLVADEWKTLVPLINEEVLREAHESGTSYSELFTKRGLQPTLRPIKTMARITVKGSVNRPDVPFKTNSDLCAFRFETPDVSQIMQTTSIIEEAVIEAGGLFFIRNSIETDGKLNDIFLCAFAYVPSIGYIAEIQVGHPFAMYTFANDTVLRDKRLAGVSTDDIVELWDNNFYGHVKSKILDPSLDVDIYSYWPGGERIAIDDKLHQILKSIV